MDFVKYSCKQIQYHFKVLELRTMTSAYFNRAKLAWYNIDPIFYSRKRPQEFLIMTSINETRRIFINEVFPQQDVVQGNYNQYTLDLAITRMKRTI